MTGLQCIKRLLPVIVGIAISFLNAPLAHAHAVLLETQPADGVVLEEAPHEIVLRFNEPIAPVSLRVVGSDGATVVDGSAVRAEGGTLRLALPDKLPAGSYVASFRVISIDSHPVTGSLLFSVGQVTAQRIGPGVTAHDHGLRLAAGCVRACFLFLVLFSAGGMLSLGAVLRFAPEGVERSRALIGSTALAALAVGMLLLGVTGCRLLGEPLTALLEWMSWRTGAQSSLGFSLLIAGVGLVALVLSRQRLDWVVGRAGAVAGSFVAIVSFGFTGHAATAAPAWLMSPAVIVHALCAAFWLGSLRPLLISLRVEPAAGAHAIFSRFSTYAVFAVALILVLGVLIAAVQIERVDMLWGSTYGLILTGKVAAVALLLMIAAYNKWWSTSLLVTDAVGANRQLRLAIYGEYALFALVLALTAALGQVEPPRALLAREAVAPSIGSADYRSSVEEGGFKISLWVAPALTGHSAVLVDVRDESNRAVAAKEVTLDLSLPAAGIEALRRVAARDDSGQFVVHSDDFIAPGHWRVDVHVLIDDFTKRSVSFDVPIR